MQDIFRVVSGLNGICLNTNSFEYLYQNLRKNTIKNSYELKLFEFNIVNTSEVIVQRFAITIKLNLRFCTSLLNLFRMHLSPKFPQSLQYDHLSDYIDNLLAHVNKDYPGLWLDTADIDQNECLHLAKYITDGCCVQIRFM